MFSITGSARHEKLIFFKCHAYHTNEVFKVNLIWTFQTDSVVIQKQKHWQNLCHFEPYLSDFITMEGVVLSLAI